MCTCVCVYMNLEASSLLETTMKSLTSKIMELLMSWWCVFISVTKSESYSSFRKNNNNREFWNAFYREQIQKNAWLLSIQHSYTFQIHAWIPTMLLYEVIDIRQRWILLFNLSTLDFFIFDFVVIVYSMFCCKNGMRQLKYGAFPDVWMVWNKAPITHMVLPVT